MTSARESLFAQIKTFLESIDGTAPYTNQIKVVSRDLTTFAALGMFPSIIMVEQGEPEYATPSSQVLLRTARLILAVGIEPAPNESASTQVNSVRSDILYRMLSFGGTQGGTCNTTKYIDNDPQVVADSGFASTDMTFEFIYRFTWSAP